MTAPLSASEVDWLRLKSHIFDPSTGRPTLAAVLEDARRLLDERDAVGLVYVDVGGGVRLEALRGWQAYDDGVAAVSGALDAAQRDGVLAASDIVAPFGPRSDKFVVFVGGDAPDGVTPERLEAVAASLQRLLRGAMPGRVWPQLGTALIRRNPMLRAERAIHQALDQAMYRSLQERTLQDERASAWLDRLIEAGSVTTLFQPIFDLAARRPVAHEAFTHGPSEGLVDDAEALFALAERTGRAAAFERLCRRRAIAALSSLRRHGAATKLFLKLSTAAANDPAFIAGGFRRELDGTGLAPADLVIEVAERMAVLDKSSFRAALRQLKSQGFRIAIDDMGAGYSSLSVIAEMEPDFLKFDISLVRHLNQSPIKRGLLETVVRLSERVQAPVVAQGIETADELAVIRDMGVPLGQGRELGPPAAPATGGAP